MKIKSIAPYFGGKRTLASDIVTELGPHSAYWEPFCGSAAVLLAKPPSGHETLNDLHGDIINLAMVIASDKAPELFDRLQRTLYTQATFDNAKKYFAEPFALTISDLRCCAEFHVIRAYWYFIVSWMGRNGVSGSARVNYQMAVRWTPGGGGGGKRFAAAVDSLPWWHNRLRNVVILNRDAFELIEKIEDEDGVVIYADPPYFMETRGNGGGSRYHHDFADEDHDRLAKLLRRFKKARVVLSYYDHPRLADLYDGWTKVSHYRNKNLHVQNRRGAKPATAPEMLLINGPSLVSPEAALF